MGEAVTPHLRPAVRRGDELTGDSRHGQRSIRSEHPPRLIVARPAFRARATAVRPLPPI